MTAERSGEFGTELGCSVDLFAGGASASVSMSLDGDFCAVTDAVTDAMVDWNCATASDSIVFNAFISILMDWSSVA